jgi:sarcosine oxidase subunit beta
MPDDIPVVGPSATSEGVFHQFGFSAHGFQLGPGTGAVMAELIATGATNLPIDGLGIGRFKSLGARHSSGAIFSERNT